MFMKCLALLPLLAAAIIGSSATSLGATFTVTNTDDSGAGSLRQAITDANTTSGADTIVFAIPGSGQKTITPASLFADITETVTIDGGNNGVATDRVEIAGAATLNTGLSVVGTGANGTTIRNLVINGFTSRQILFLFTASGTIAGNFLGLDATGSTIVTGSVNGIEVFDASSSSNTIGGADSAARNVVSSNTATAIVLNGFGGDVIQGNFIGVNAAGTAAVGNPQQGVGINNGSATVGGMNPGEGNVIVASTGIAFAGNPALSRSSGTAQGNFIGTDVTGMISLKGGIGTGIDVIHGQNVVIDGGNVISGNNIGIQMSSSGISGASSLLVTVQGNFIGTGADGVTALGNSGNGINSFGSDNNTIGGTNSGEGNVIAFNGGIGVQIAGGIENAVEGNSIFSNGGLGIDLDIVGVSLNDVDDFDIGANNLQNFPVITGVTTTATDVTITGIFKSLVNKDYRLEFFGNEGADTLGFGEGEFFLGATDVTTDAAGGAAFDVTFPLPALASRPITGVSGSALKSFTATAIDGDGNTSEFSHAFGVKLQNISTRLNVLTGENVLIGGFIVTGDTAKEVIIRAIGPSIIGLSGLLADPVLELHKPDGSVVTNDNWKDTQQAEIEATGIPPTNDNESAIVDTLDPGNYTAIVSGKNGGTGIALVEIYDLDQFLGPIMANISTRGLVDIDDNVMIGGFIVGPIDSGLADVLIRAIGPSLSDFGIDHPLLDPLLELHDVNGATIATNDNWKESQQTEIEATGIPPTEDSESALIQTLATGNYTAIVRGMGNTTGVALVEIYNLPNTL
jgi:hypothetical protein